ncbi:MAG: hypothetical protein FJY66_05350, partial [Calditrichaeota bacterium]|nr:hypothetical protein [Calditrichota bacterium]
MIEPVQLLEKSLLHLWRALLDEKSKADSVPPHERIQGLFCLLDQMAERAQATDETLAVAQPTENERLLFQLWPKGLPHLSDLRTLAQRQGEPIEWGDVEA